MTQVELASRAGEPFQRMNQIVRQRQAITPDTALLLAQPFGTTPAFWLNLQQAWEQNNAISGPIACEIQIKPLKRAG
jgi:addiction module HigA family antidote